MKWCAISILIVSIFASTASAQSARQATKDRLKLFSGWLEIVNKAERNFKATHGRYGDLDDLRKAQLLDALVFESDSSAGDHGTTSCPKTCAWVGNWLLTVSSDGRSFRAMIGVGCMSLQADDTGDIGEESMGCRPPMLSPPDRFPPSPFPLPLPQDGPEGPIIVVTG